MNWAAPLGTFADLLEFVGIKRRCDTGQSSQVDRVALADLAQSAASDSALVAVVAARSRYQVEHILTARHRNWYIYRSADPFARNEGGVCFMTSSSCS